MREKVKESLVYLIDNEYISGEKSINLQHHQLGEQDNLLWEQR